MAGRIRSIKPEILDDEEVCALSDEAWRLWVSMWLLADDHGNLRAGDRYLAALVWQDTGRSPRVAEILRELRRGRIEVYTNGGERYAHIRNWEKHQRIDNAGKERVPSPFHEQSIPWEQFRGESPRVSASLGDLPLDQRPPTSTNDPDHRPPTEDSTASAPPRIVFDFDAVYAGYPRKEGRKKGLQRCRSQVTSRLKYDALVTAVKNYAAHVAGRDMQYVKKFDSFMGSWEDYVDAGIVTPTRSAPARGVAPPIPAYAESGEEPL